MPDGLEVFAEESERLNEALGALTRHDRVRVRVSIDAVATDDPRKWTETRVALQSMLDESRKVAASLEKMVEVAGEGERGELK